MRKKSPSVSKNSFDVRLGRLLNSKMSQQLKHEEWKYIRETNNTSILRSSNNLQSKINLRN